MTSTIGRLLAASIGIAEIRFLLRTIGFARTIRMTTVVPRLLSAAEAPDPRLTAEVDWAAERVGGTCLDRSVLLWFILRQHGLDPALRIGVARIEGAIDGHAWVELDGAVMNDTPDIADRFLPFHDDPTALVFS